MEPATQGCAHGDEQPSAACQIMQEQLVKGLNAGDAHGANFDSVRCVSKSAATKQADE